MIVTRRCQLKLCCNHKSNKKNQSKTLNFYDSAKYQTLTIAPIVNQPESLDNQIQIDNDLEVLPASNIPQPSTSASSNVPASSRKRSHDENCLLVCINCLEKVKEKRPKKICASESLSATLTSLYPNFPQDKVYLPQIICQSCSTKVKDLSAEVSVKYTALVFSVKLSKCFNKDVNDKVCEMCRIASATINPVKSPFLLKCKPNPGRPAKMVQRKITDFSGFQKIKSKKRKFQVLNECYFLRYFLNKIINSNDSKGLSFNIHFLLKCHLLQFSDLKRLRQTGMSFI